MWLHPAWGFSIVAEDVPVLMAKRAAAAWEQHPLRRNLNDPALHAPVEKLGSTSLASQLHLPSAFVFFRVYNICFSRKVRDCVKGPRDIALHHCCCATIQMKLGPPIINGVTAEFPAGSDYCCIIKISWRSSCLLISSRYWNHAWLPLLVRYLVVNANTARSSHAPCDEGWSLRGWTIYEESYKLDFKFWFIIFH